MSDQLDMPMVQYVLLTVITCEHASNVVMPVTKAEGFASPSFSKSLLYSWAHSGACFVQLMLMHTFASNALLRGMV